ncbi:MAG: Ig-like domain-containing protein [Syntrophothermaceae bacterium]
MLKKLTRSKTWLALLVVFTFLVWNVVPLGALAADEEIPGQKPLNFVGAYLTEISNNTSTTGPAIDQTTVPVDPLIKVQFDKNIVNDAVWEHNQQCVAIQTDAGAVVPTQVTRVKDSVNFNEKNNIFITPVNDLQKGGAYKVVVSPELKAKNGYSTLGMTTNNQPVIINFKVAGSIQVPVSGVTLNKTSITLNEGQSERLTATVTPANATNKLVAWSSSNASVATVDGNGNVTGVKAGSAVITVKTADGGKMATCQVTVKAVTVPVTGVTLNKTSITLNEGQSERLTATVTPANATNKAVTWSSSNASVATVDGNGNVTGVKAGSVVITVKTADGNKTATCQVTVKAVTVPVSGVTLNKTSITLNEGQSESLTATVTPANATNKAVTWSSSNASAATVDANGKVTVVKAGSTVITVKTADGNKMATCQVTVKAVTVPVSGVTLNKTSITLNEGQSESLTATVTPANATNKAVTWSSSNASAATVDANGKVTAVKAGSTVITVKTVDGGKMATCQVTVKAVTVPVSGVTLNKTSITLNEGQSESLNATVTPANATNKAVTWSSSNASAATMDANGKVTAVKAGSAVITVKTADGGKTATCQVTVVAAAEDPDSEPLTFVGAYLARMKGLSSVTVSELGQGETSVKPMIKLVFNQNVVNDTVWNHNRQCISLQDSSGAKVRVMVFRISDKTNPDESTNIFVTPLNELQRGGVYKLVVSPELKAKDGQALGETASQGITAGFKVTSYSWFQRLCNFIQGDKCADLFCSRVQFITQLFKSKCKGAAGYKMPLQLA